MQHPECATLHNGRMELHNNNIEPGTKRQEDNYIELQRIGLVYTKKFEILY